MAATKFRENCFMSFAAVLTLGVLATVAGAQGGAPGGQGAPGAAGGAGGRGPQPVKAAPLPGKDNVYLVTGGVGSNTGFVVGTDGVIIFDPKGSPDSARDVLAEIAKVTKLPVTTIVVSHSNPDHTKGLPGYAKGVNIIAQQNAAKDIEALTFYMTWGVTGGGDQSGSDKPYLPTQTFDTRADLKINGVNVELMHWAPAHTNGDTVMYLPDKKVAFVGDLGGTGIHLENNGSSEGMIESIRGLLALDADTYVRGHAMPGTKDDLQKGLDDLVTKRSKIVGLYETGVSLDDAEKAMGEKVNPRMAPSMPGLKPFRAGRDMNFTEIVYDEMSRR